MAVKEVDATLTIEELTQIAAEFLQDNYGTELGIPIKRNNRLRTAMGRYLETYEGEPYSIEIAGFTIEHGSREVVIDTLYHECIHYALHVRDKPNDDGHPYFEAELKRLGVSSSRTNKVGIYVEYTCQECERKAEARGKRLLKDHYYRVTRCCGADIVIVGERIYNGTEAV